MNGGTAAVEVVDLVKRYPRAPKDSLAGVTFAVRRGEVFGFLGPNGAGKTTTIGILTTRVRPTRGRATVAGVDVIGDPVGARRVLGVVPQTNNLDRSLSVRQNLLFHASYHGVPRARRMALADELLAQFGLADRANGRPDDFSGGQIQRMMIARALMHSPAVLFLDEPSTGLDPAARLFLWEKVAELKQSGTTVVITTHDMDEAATLSDRVAIIDHGTVLALDTPETLVRGMTGERTLDCTIDWGPDTDTAGVETTIASLAGVTQIEHLDDPDGNGWRLRIYVRGEAASFVAPVAQAIGDSGGRLTDARLGEPNLEDVFIHLTGEEPAMTVEVSRSDPPALAPDELHHWGPGRTFLAILRRDLFVTGREFPVFLAQVILQPLFLLFVFGKVLTELGYARPGYEQVLFPGLVALAAVLTGLQSTALPLVIEFSYSNEIEDRLLAPLPIGAVAIEKVVFAALRACVAAAVMFPVGVWILGAIPWQASTGVAVVVMVILGSLLGAAMGLILGTYVPPNRISVTLTLVITPLIFTGSSQYPWPSLGHLRWFQVLSALNPMTYVSEGLRGLMAPQVPHIQTWICFVVAVASLVLLMAVGMLGFIRRALG